MSSWSWEHERIRHDKEKMESGGDKTWLYSKMNNIFLRRLSYSVKHILRSFFNRLDEKRSAKNAWSRTCNNRKGHHFFPFPFHFFHFSFAIIFDILYRIKKIKGLETKSNLTVCSFLLNSILLLLLLSIRYKLWKWKQLWQTEKMGAASCEKIFIIFATHR